MHTAVSQAVAGAVGFGLVILAWKNFRFAYLSLALFVWLLCVCCLFACLFGQCLNEYNEAHLNGTCLRAGIVNELEAKGHLFSFVCLLSEASTATLDSFSFFLPFVAPFNYSNLFVSTLCLDILK